jgi:hypothetical protein
MLWSKETLCSMTDEPKFFTWLSYPELISTYPSCAVKLNLFDLMDYNLLYDLQHIMHPVINLQTT